MRDEDSLLPWLLPAPADLRARLKAADGDAQALQRLASYALDVGQLGRLAERIGTTRDALVGAGCVTLRLGLACSFTSDYLRPALEGSALRHGLMLETTGTDYGQVAQAVLDPGSPFRGRVDAVLLALDPTMLGLDRPRLDDDAGEAAVDNAIATMAALCEGVRGQLAAACLVATLPAPLARLFGESDRRTPGTPRQMIEAFNRRLLAEIVQPGDAVIDIAALAETIGLSRWHDARGWHSAKLPFALDATPLYADHVARVLAALRGKARKCLVLDLDNTLWGGVIGDDGLEGLRLGQGDAIGEAHVALQNYALALRERGVILAICSKNDEDNARLPFASHPEMILKEEHIAAFVANWADKASNLRDIAAMLDIGTDALVFLDDNPAEREIVRRELPEVAVPEIGADAADYVAMLSAGGWFEAVAFSAEDRARADYYQANAERRSAQGALTDMAEYLRSLEMAMTIAPFDPVGRSRVAQLVNKSNQFNLTTRRYTETDIATFETSPDRFTAQIRLADRFGDNGMISVVIFEKAGEVWDCDTWLMSCRVLGRRVEEAVLARVAAAARAEGATRLRGTYLPTKKNALVAGHFARLGFARVDEAAGGGSVWELDLTRYEPPDLPIKVDA